MKILPTVTYSNVENLTTSYDYRQAVLSLTDSVICAINEALEDEQIFFNKEEIEELVNDSLLHETIDGSQYAIYFHYHLDILKHSDNSDYAIENILCGDEMANILRDNGLTGLHQALAFWALMEDVQEQLNEHISQIDFEEVEEA